jgi:hypothetical protein
MPHGRLCIGRDFATNHSAHLAGAPQVVVAWDVEEIGNRGQCSFSFSHRLQMSFAFAEVPDKARSIRLKFEGAFYHVMARGSRRAAIFWTIKRGGFLQCLADVCEKTGWRVHAWVLMGNHYHFFIQRCRGRR